MTKVSEFLLRLFYAPSILGRRNLETDCSLWKRHSRSHSPLRFSYPALILVPRPQPAKRSEKGYGDENVKTHQIFSVHSTPVEFKNATISGHFGFVFEENSGKKITWLSWRHRFRKAPLSWRTSVDGRPNSKNKAARKKTLTWSFIHLFAKNTQLTHCIFQVRT